MNLSHTLVLAVLLAVPSITRAISAGNVLVLYNAADPDSVQIANYYLTVHPSVRLVGLTNVPVGDEITQGQYRSIIRPQVLSALTPSTDVIVTTKGLPVRIYNDRTPASFPYTYTDPLGTQHTIYSDTYKRYSSLESELTRVDTFSTWVQMGDQTWWYPPAGVSSAANPYFGRNVPFSHNDPANGQLRLTARLDGYSVSDVIGSINRAQNVYIVPKGEQVVIDDSPAAVAAGVSSMPNLANNVLAPRGQSYIYDDQVAPVLTAPKPVIGYVSHGTNDGSGQLQPDYMQSQLRFQIAKGAIAETWESFNGYSFNAANRRGQGLIADWIAAGGTGGIANVEEPGASLSTVTNEDRLYSMLLDGYTWAEAAWGATPQVSYVNTVVGDPLMTWRKWLPGDANLDGRVDIMDLMALEGHWMQSGGFSSGDFNGDGVVNVADLTILQQNWQRNINAVAVGSTSQEESVPEPASIACVMLLAGFVGRRSRRQG